MVSVSRTAGSPQRGHGTLAHSVAAPSGEAPFGLRSRPSAEGSTIGSWSSGTATSPQESQWMIGMGVPQ